MKKVYIVILNYNNPVDTIECLDSIYRLNYPDYHVIVCDNLSTDDSEKQILNWKYRVHPINFTFVQTYANKGYAGGNNVGIRFAMEQGDMDYVWILNNDTIVTPESLTALVSKMQSVPAMGICGSKLIYLWDKTRVQSLGGRFNKYFGTTRHIVKERDLAKLEFVVGASMLISKEFLDDIGLFCEDYFLYYEEMDLAMRAKGKYTMGCALDSVVYHKEGASTGGSDGEKNNKSLIADYYSLRNRIFFMKKFFPEHMWSVYLGFIITIFNRLKRRQYSRIKMIFALLIGTSETTGSNKSE